MLTPCAQDEVVEVAFALSHHEAVKIAETPRQPWQLWHDKDEGKYE